jgi:hypothetical protein
MDREPAVGSPFSDLESDDRPMIALAPVWA